MGQKAIMLRKMWTPIFLLSLHVPPSLLQTVSSTTPIPAAWCPEGWIHAHTEGCFTFLQDTNLTWLQAMAACEQIGGYLAEPKTGDQMEFLAGFAGFEEDFTGIQNWWIGLSDVGHEGLWLWVHSYEEATAAFWGHGSPSEKEGNTLDCAYAAYSKGQLTWKDINCWDVTAHHASIAPICQRGEVEPGEPTTMPATTTSEPQTTTPTMAECPEAWSRFQDSCYWVYEELSTWVGAKEVCQEMVPGAHLAFANSQKENSYIVSLNSSNSNTQLWLGGTDSAIEGNWTWTDGSTFTFTNWYSFEGNGGIAENCLALDTYNYATYWFDAACFHSKYFICEIDLF